MAYDIDYLQGRILLAAPLSWVAVDNLLVRTSGLSGDEAYLVARYEFTPGFDGLDAVSYGGQGHYWFGDHVRLGVTANSNKEGDTDSSLGAADLTFQMSSASWVKLQAGKSQGLVQTSLLSPDGGFQFVSRDDPSFVDANAGAYRADVSVGLGDIVQGTDGRLTLYAQNIEAGYSAPGYATLKDTEHYGGAFRMAPSSRGSLAAKGGQKTQDPGLATRAPEGGLCFQ